MSAQGPQRRRPSSTQLGFSTPLMAPALQLLVAVHNPRALQLVLAPLGAPAASLALQPRISVPGP